MGEKRTGPRCPNCGAPSKAFGAFCLPCQPLAVKFTPAEPVVEYETATVWRVRHGDRVHARERFPQEAVKVDFENRDDAHEAARFHTNMYGQHSTVVKVTVRRRRRDA